ncbi:MAG: MBL fold metallo-hydrolase [Planctomycetes bacterium]|nr:MBL fold metallo-hydrolase [Planctomycetota bacterium]MCP4770977.1 MBL fold metallo-hydrolase [Planctomycetota bacterium]MCP4861696.1 MBL fold metallo-hydrolase [Planctomycetota bacterium]
MSSRSIQIGDFRVVALRDANFALDGGAMFGVVPRVMWERMTPVNEDHTIPLATNPFLIEGNGVKIVVEPGMGHRWGDRQRKMFHIDFSDGHELTESLKAAGVQPEEVTHCLMSHCHFDHIGAACDADGKPVFGNAEHWTPEVEKQAIMADAHLRKASYRIEDLQPIVDAGLLKTFEGETEIVPGISMIQLKGHSEGVSLIKIESQGQVAVYWADVVPTRNHVHLPFIMAYDINAEDSWEVRNEWIPRSTNEGWVALLYHDPIAPIGKFAFDGKRYTFEAREG